MNNEAAQREAVPDGGAENTLSAPEPFRAGNAASSQCPYCLASFRKRQPHQLFCSPSHKRAYNKLWEKRGAMVCPLVIVARITRNGDRGRHKDIGKRASRDVDHLIQRWRDEDLEAGRMPVSDYVAARYRLGLVEVA